MLDEQHGKTLDFAQSASDKNSYTWGRVGAHNVVMASLVAGVYGTTLATTTAMSMLSSFPQIRVGLMVGIGAVVPRLERGCDIRLGDIFVSQPVGQSGGAVQYYLIKAKKCGFFERKGIPNMPPEVLLNALAKLQAQHEIRPSKVAELLEEMGTRNPCMSKSTPGRPGYVYQGKENDRFFKATYSHIDGFGCSNCDSDQEIQRDDRDSTEPQIHYGIIASSNMLVKDAATRDSIVRDLEEFATMRTPTKNDRWQRYAAATAAAYAKEFLSVIPAQMIATTTKATDALKEVNVLESIQEVLNPTLLEKNNRCRRTAVILQGIGGIGKTQTALEYIRHNRNMYRTVFWIDISNASTIDVSAKRIMDELISHYAKKYPGEERFGSIAADLQIPGRIDSQGQLRGNAAKSPWQCVRKWLARDANTGWCLVVDGINDEADGDPKTAAEQVTEMLGYLPLLPLTQAAAYIKKKALRLVQYLGRLRNNIVRLIGEKFLKYSGGVFSCWELSIQELVKSYAHAFDLLRLCSFLSPNGISVELLYRGLEAIEWAHNGNIAVFSCHK
ncbi:hypothetical protein ACJ73_08948 [Blastomyces percursus]|uniref:Nucleoside phosphorylase domain-containing protein n=1 Tax=Blastomyces percursus TaxID=1658174 RepID=A0A1J9PH64_9EURO|nr:hypothetical protein ACJ73_08948 [Blastomyces percursus]